MFHEKPIIGIAGGIGSGKSFIARLFGELGCCVIHSDDQVRMAYSDPEIRRTLRGWWGEKMIRADDSIDRRAVAELIFASDADRIKLEKLLHPWVMLERYRMMAKAIAEPNLKAFVWDTPLLFETGLHHNCDALVFVDAPEEMRFHRVMESRGWNRSEIIRREKLQWPLDKKQKMAHYVVVNTADVATSRSQVREILSRILEN